MGKRKIRSKNIEIKLNKTDYSRRKKSDNESSFLRQNKKYFNKILLKKVDI